MNILKRSAVALLASLPLLPFVIDRSVSNRSPEADDQFFFLLLIPLLLSFVMFIGLAYNEAGKQKTINEKHVYAITFFAIVATSLIIILGDLSSISLEGDEKLTLIVVFAAAYIAIARNLLWIGYSRSRWEKAFWMTYLLPLVLSAAAALAYPFTNIVVAFYIFKNFAEIFNK